MNLDEETGRLLGTQGWQQLLTCKKELLDAFDRARQHSRAHEIETYHGIVAEAQLRNWLSDFLPQKYGVTAGYIVSQGASEKDKLPAFDVIIYDQLESPVLWIESHPDVSPLGKMRAIPAEYVKAVIEVKAVWNSASATKAVDHLGDLAPLLALDPPTEPYKKFLPWNFTSWVVFFDLLQSERRSLAALNNALPTKLPRGYAGGVVFRGPGLSLETTGRLEVARLANPSEAGDLLEEGHELKRPDWSLLGGCSMSDAKRMEDGDYYQMSLSWFPQHFAGFAFDLIACLNGTKRRLYAGWPSSFGTITSRRGLTENPELPRSAGINPTPVVIEKHLKSRTAQRAGAQQGKPVRSARSRRKQSTLVPQTSKGFFDIPFELLQYTLI